jgi:hypothetical protein
MMRLLGDIHGNVEFYEKFVLQEPEVSTFQVGDFGLGFKKYLDFEFYCVLRDTPNPIHKFIRGNHDDPAVCLNINKQIGRTVYLPDWGYDRGTGIFWLGGAYSIDWMHRTPGKSWWRDEEINSESLHEAIRKYEELKPRFVVTHDCPAFIYPTVLGAAQRDKPVSRTSQALESMFAVHQPQKWYFGHMHVSWKEMINGTEFRCLDIEESVDDQDIPGWET